MARDAEEELRRRRRKREEERAKDEQNLEARKERAGGGEKRFSDNLEELLKRAEPMIEQLNNLYRQYTVGLEQRPPIERRKQLDQLMATLELMAKPTVQQQFKFNNLQANYIAHRSRWDKLVKGVEAGRIKRPMVTAREKNAKKN